LYEIRNSRSLRWERGLKSERGFGGYLHLLSLPSLGAWIEGSQRLAKLFTVREELSYVIYYNIYYSGAYICDFGNS
ncbi:MAG: hypothetical protein WBI88_09325, partial [Caldicoprobacterales bacterium]